MKPPSSEFDHSALSTELSTYQELHEGCWDVSFKSAVQYCRIRSQYDNTTAQYLKDVKYKEFNPVDFGWAPGILESRVKV